MLTYTEILWSFQIGVLAYIATCVLMQQDYILEGYFDLLIKLKHYSKFGKWLSKPLGLCEKCASGQLGLWIWLEANLDEYCKDPFEAFLRHIIFISFCILFVILIKLISEKCKK